MAVDSLVWTIYSTDMGTILRRIRYLGRRERFDRELDDEIRFHIESRAEELQREGVPAQEALERARREFGSRVRLREDSRAAWQFQWLEDLWRDIRYGMRAFAKSPGFAFVVILSLGIGVAANYVMFTVVDSLLLRPPQIPRANEVVALVSTTKESNGGGLSYPDYTAVRDRNQSFRDLAAFTPVTAGFAASPGSEPRVKDGKLVSVNFFSLIGVRPELGRSFAAGEEQTSGNDRVAILSHNCWQDQFGADPAVLGKQARINGIGFTVVGVMPARFTDVDDDLSDDEPDFYLPIRSAARIGAAPDLLENRGQRSLTVLGRLKPGVPLTQARADVATIASALEKDYPQTNKDRGLTVRTVIEFRSGGSGGITMGALAMTLAGMVLLVACANIAGLLTSRAPARAQEIAMRLAIGAGRPRLIRQLLTENLLLAAAGGLAGIAIGYIPIALAKRLTIEFDPRLASSFPFGLNARLLVFSMGVAFLSVVLFGLLPAFQATRADLVSVIKGANNFVPRGRWLRRLFRGRNLLVAGQVAVSLVLLTVTSFVYAGVYKGLVTSIRNPGFEVDHLLGIDFDPATMHYKDARAAQFFKDLGARLRATRGVNSAALEYQDIAAIRPESVKDDVRTSGVWIDEGFFDTLGIPLVEGRGIRTAELGASPAVAVVNDVLARHYWPGQSGVGKQIRMSTGQWVTVVGVAKLRAFMAWGTPPMDTIFLPYGVPVQRDIRLIARSSGDPQGLIEPIRGIVRDLDPDQAMPDAYTFDRTIGIFMRAAMLSIDTLGAMGVLGLGLALVGLYGLLAYEVGSRTREIGIRMALGARAGAVVRMVLRQGVALAVFGVAVGSALNWGVGRVVLAIFGVGSNPGANANPPAPEPNGGNQIGIQAGTQYFGGEAFTLLILAVLVVTIVAAYIPARRAARVDPNVALRAE
jgi:macrolide transport system ATP-binding/permease protein